MVTSIRPATETRPALERQARELLAHLDALRRSLLQRLLPCPESDIELSPQDARALMLLEDKGPVTMSDYAEALGVPLSTATHAVERLIAKNLATRSRIEEDRRVVRVELSSEGQRVNRMFGEHRLALGRHMLEALTPGEREIFLELMTKIAR